MTELLQAAEAGNVAVATAILQRGQYDVCNRTTRYQGGHAWTALHVAIHNGHVAVVKCLLRHPETFVLANGRAHLEDDTSGWTALHETSLQGHVAIAELLLGPDSGFNAANEFTSPTNVTALHIAAIEGHVGIIRCFFWNQHVFNAFNAKATTVDNAVGWTALHLACKMGHSSVASVLLSEPHVFTVSNSTVAFFGGTHHYRGWTALHIAAKYNRTAVIAELLENAHVFHAVDGRASNSDGRRGLTAFHIAARSGRLDAIASMLQHDRCQTMVNSPSGDGETAMHLAASHGHEFVVQFLLSHGSFRRNLVNETVKRFECDGSWLGCTALHLAALSGKEKVASVLIEHGSRFAVVNDTCSATIFEDHATRVTALHAAALKGHPAVVQRLLEPGNAYTAINTRDSQGYNALLMAAVRGHAGVAEALLASVNFTDTATEVKGREWPEFGPAYLAVRFGHAAVLEVMLRNSQRDTGVNTLGVDNQSILDDAVHFAKLGGGRAVMQLLLHSGRFDLCNARSTSTDDGISFIGCTALHRAAYHDDPDAVMLLLRPNTNFTAQSETCKYVTKDHGIEVTDVLALHIACGCGHVGVARLLLQHTVSKPFARNSLGATAFHNAVVGGHVVVMRACLEYSRRFMQGTCREGGLSKCTALHIASFRGHEAAVECLLEQEEAQTILSVRCEPYAQTALHLAAAEGRARVVQLILCSDRSRTIAGLPARGAGAVHIPIHIAAFQGHVNVMRVMLDMDPGILADRYVTAATPRGDTILHLAAACGHESVVKLLLAHPRCFGSAPGQQHLVNMSNEVCETALHQAAQCGSGSCLDLVPLAQAARSCGTKAAYVRIMDLILSNSDFAKRDAWDAKGNLAVDLLEPEEAELLECTFRGSLGRTKAGDDASAALRLSGHMSQNDQDTKPGDAAEVLAGVSGA